MDARDGLNLTTTSRAGKVAMEVVTAFQDRVPKGLSNPGELIAGTALALLMLCDAGKVDPGYALQVGQNLYWDGQKRRPEHRGAREYILREVYHDGE